MRKPLRLLIALTMATIGSIAIAADDDVAESAAKVETELASKMDQMGSAFRKLRRQVGDPARNAQSLEQLAVLRKHAITAVELEPLKATEVPVSERAKMVEGYRTKIREMLAQFDKLEAALRAARNDEAVKLVQEIVTLQKAGHQKYKSKSFE